jgi:hypothetical protein
MVMVMVGPPPPNYNDNINSGAATDFNKLKVQISAYNIQAAHFNSNSDQPS